MGLCGEETEDELILINSQNKLNRQDSFENKDISTKVCLAYFLCIGSVVLYVVSFMSVSYLKGAVPENELNLIRYSSATVITGTILFITDRERYKSGLSLAAFGYTVLLTIVIIFLNSSLYNSPVYIPIGVIACGLSCLATLVVNAMFSSLNKEERRLDVYLGLFAVIVGFCIVMHHEFSYPSENFSSKDWWLSPCFKRFGNDNLTLNYNSRRIGQYIYSWDWYTSSSNFGYFLALGSGILISINTQLIRNIKEDMSPMVLMFHRNILASLFSLLLMLIFEEPFFPSDLYCILCLFGHAVVLAIHGLSQCYCLKILTTSTVNLLSSLNLVVLLAIQYAFMSGIMPTKQNWLEGIGALFSCLGAIGGTMTQLFEG